MEKLVPELYYSYGKYVTQNKMLPNIVDGLLPVGRRIILTTSIVAKDKFTKTAKITGENMARFHPHAPAEGTCAWAVQNGFCEGRGQWGGRIGIGYIKPAHPRYTEMRSSKFIEEVAFKYIKHVPWKEIEVDPEPQYLPTMIPFCLFQKTEFTSIAFGFKSDIPNFKFDDLIKRLFFLIGKTKKRITIKPNIDGCEILSSNKEIENLLINGHGKIEICGNYTIDKQRQRVIVHGYSPRMTFESLLNKIDKYEKLQLFSNQNIGYVDQSTDKTGTSIIFEVVRQRDKEEYFNKMVNAVTEALKASLTYNIIVVDLDGEIKSISVDDMLLNTYSYYKEAVDKYLKSQEESIMKKIEDIEIIKSIQPHISECITKNKNLENTILCLSKKTNIEVDAIKSICEKYNIKKLLSDNKIDTKEFNDKLNEIKLKLSKLEESVNKEYSAFLK